MNQQLVLEQSKAVTGDATLESSPITNGKKDKHASNAIASNFFGGSTPWFVWAVLTLVTPLILMKVYDIIRSGR